ncbi:MAG: hypothetical protein M3224_03355 [Thermoproteota archaeon]|nr:hypothetical protein [Thermoproteota archaeon]
MTNSIFAQAQQDNAIGVKIISPITGQQVPIGELTISGISTDNAITDCTVYADWNNLKPFQKAIATGPGGVNDYSKWNFTYTPQYHIITNGTNNLGAQISCFNSDTLANITKSYSVNVTGIIESSEQSALAAQNVSSSLPSIKIDNDDNKTATTRSPQIIPSVPTTSPLPLQPAIKDDEEKEQTEEEPEPESEPQPTTSSTGDDTTEDDTDEEENTSEQETEVEEVQEEEEVQEQLQQILEKVGKVEEEVQQEVGKVEEDILEEIESGLR